MATDLALDELLADRVKKAKDKEPFVRCRNGGRDGRREDFSDVFLISKTFVGFLFGFNVVCLLWVMFMFLFFCFFFVGYLVFLAVFYAMLMLVVWFWGLVCLVLRFCWPIVSFRVPLYGFCFFVFFVGYSAMFS